MLLQLLNENNLKMRIRNKYVEVYSLIDPQGIIGKEYVGDYDDTENLDEAWEVVDMVLGHIMPIDLVEEEYIENYNGVHYMGGDLSMWICPKCKNYYFINNKDFSDRCYNGRCKKCLGTYDILVENWCRE